MDRAAELEEIDAFIAARGATRCPAAFSAEVRGAMTRETEAARIAAVRVKELPSRVQNHRAFVLGIFGRR